MTLQGKELPLSKALAEISKQTGNEVADRRQSKEDVKIRLDLKGVTFWQALDAVAKAADANVAVFERDNKIALTDGPFQACLPVTRACFAPGSSAYRSLIISKLIPGRHSLRWKLPGSRAIQPLFIEGQADDLYIEDEKGRTVELPEPSRGQVSTSKATPWKLSCAPMPHNETPPA